MTRYSVPARSRTPARSQQPAAIWRGIGCLLMLAVPAAAWILADATIRWALEQRWPVPYQLLGYPVLPKFLVVVPGVASLLTPILAQQNIYAIATLCLFYTIIGGALISFLYAVVYRLVGPPRYGPLDAPPPPVKVRKYKR